MFRCPLCGASARIRTSRNENDSGTVRLKYYQCNNLECGIGFTTLEVLTNSHQNAPRRRRVQSGYRGKIFRDLTGEYSD